MERNEILTELRKAIPGNVDYGQINEFRVEHYNNLTLSRLVDVILEPDYDRFVQSLADNVRLGIEEW